MFRRSRRGMALVLAAVLAIALVVASATQIVQSHHSSQTLLHQRFEDRAKADAELLGDVFFAAKTKPTPKVLRKRTAHEFFNRFLSQLSTFPSFIAELDDHGRPYIVSGRNSASALRGPDRFTASGRAIGGLSLTLSIRRDVLFASVPSTTFSWIVLGALALALALLLLLLDLLWKQSYDLRESNRELERSNADLELFASTASHDVSSPLRRIIVFAELIEQAGGLDTQSRDYLQRITRQAKTLVGLTSTLIEYARVGGDHVAKPVSLDEAWRVALVQHEEEINQMRARLSVKPLGFALGSDAAFVEIFGRLVGNSLKYHREGEPPEIEVYARDGARDCVEVCVRDHGLGIPEEKRERMFEAFSRLNVDRPGFGLGLAIVARIASRLGGSARAESPPDGEGVVIVVSLKRARR